MKRSRYPLDAAAHFVMLRRTVRRAMAQHAIGRRSQAAAIFA